MNNMVISERIKEALEKNSSTFKNDDDFGNYMNFIREMERKGILRPQQYTIVPPSEGTMEQLKAVAITPHSIPQ